MEKLIFLLIVGVIAIIKWAIENAGKMSRGNDPEEINFPREHNQGPSMPRSNPRPISGGETEEEKMRRFMEALGLPQGGTPPPVRKPALQPAPKPASPPPYRPLPVPQPQPTVSSLPTPRPSHRNVGYPTAGGPRPPEFRPRRSVAPPLETGGPLPAIPKTAPVSETAPSMEVVAPELSMGHPEKAVSTAGDDVYKSLPAPTQGGTGRTGAQMQASLRGLLRNPASLRTAILLREILSPPKGLQSAQTPSIFSIR